MLTPVQNFTKFALMALIITSFSHLNRAGSYPQQPVKFSEIIKKDDPRYLGFLGTGGVLSFLGVVVMAKSLLVNTQEQQEGKSRFGEDLTSFVSSSAKFGLGLFLTAAGLLVIANSRNIPGYFEAIEQLEPCCK